MSALKNTLWLAGMVAAAVLVVLAGCNNQYPDYEPVKQPGKPLTWAEQHKLDNEHYQQLNLDRIN